MLYEVIVCQQGILRLTDLLAVVIRLFKIKNLEMRILDSQENIEEIDWNKNAITILTKRNNIYLSKNEKLICLFFIYKNRNTGNNNRDNIELKITEL
jgi:hypothetical protein